MVMKVNLPGSRRWISWERARCWAGALGQACGSGSSEMLYPATLGSPAFGAISAMSATSETSQSQVESL